MITDVKIEPNSLLEVTTPLKTADLSMRLSCDRDGRSVVTREYVNYPFRLSRTLRLDRSDPNRAYLYIMSASPGLLAGDNLRVCSQLDANTSLYLTDQAATKVHSMPIAGTAAKMVYEITVGAGANLEFVPEPLILYTDATLEQITQVRLHPTGRLFISEIILPGRLARGEFYRFHQYFSRLQVTSPTGEILFADAMRLEGKLNPFKENRFFSSLPVICNIFIVLPDIDMKRLSAELEDLEAAACWEIIAGSSLLPHCNGLLVRAMAGSAYGLKIYVQYALNCVRRVSGQPPLPKIPK